MLARGSSFMSVPFQDRYLLPVGAAITLRTLAACVVSSPPPSPSPWEGSSRFAPTSLFSFSLFPSSFPPFLPGPFSPFSGPEALFFHLPGLFLPFLGREGLFRLLRGQILPYSGPVGDRFIVEVRWSKVFGAGLGHFSAQLVGWCSERGVSFYRWSKDAGTRSRRRWCSCSGRRKCGRSSRRRSRQGTGGRRG